MGVYTISIGIDCGGTRIDRHRSVGTFEEVQALQLEAHEEATRMHEAAPASPVSVWTVVHVQDPETGQMTVASSTGENWNLD